MTGVPAPTGGLSARELLQRAEMWANGLTPVTVSQLLELMRNTVEAHADVCPTCDDTGTDRNGAPCAACGADGSGEGADL